MSSSTLVSVAQAVAETRPRPAIFAWWKAWGLASHEEGLRMEAAVLAQWYAHRALSDEGN